MHARSQGSARGSPNGPDEATARSTGLRWPAAAARSAAQRAAAGAKFDLISNVAALQTLADRQNNHDPGLHA